jgi:diketogulonate reductase-like aldo/keto reductase
MPFLTDLLTVLSIFFSPESHEVNGAIANTHHHHTPSTLVPTISIGVDVYGNSVDMPLVGAGTWQYNDTIAYESVCKAFRAGYTFVDTAFGYGNQRGVGQAIRDCYSGKREDLFVMTKIPGGLRVSEALAALEENLVELQLDHVDHVMVHYPSDWQASPDRANKAARQETWLALERVYYKGQARSIGISHYCSQHIHDILEVATVMPSINQVEYHVGSGDVNDVIQTCRQHNITFMSFSPLCGPCQASPEHSLISGGLVTSIAKKYNVTGSQVSLRFIVQQALTKNSFMGGVIPKSNNKDHISHNRDLFGFELSDADMETLFAATEPAGEKGDCTVP